MRPTVMMPDTILRWAILTRNPDTQVLKDADSLPTVTVQKLGVGGTTSVTPVKRSATTGIYDCEYNPSGELPGEAFEILESVTITGSPTLSATYVDSWDCVVIPSSLFTPQIFYGFG